LANFADFLLFSNFSRKVYQLRYLSYTSYVEFQHGFEYGWLDRPTYFIFYDVDVIDTVQELLPL
jgi:hypothetical protein